MYIKNNSVSFVFQINENASPPNDLDTTFTDPDGVTQYIDSNGVYVKPTTNSKGSLTFSKSFSKAGLWFIKISSGSSASHTIYSNQAINIVEHDPDFKATIII